MREEAWTDKQDYRQEIATQIIPGTELSASVARELFSGGDLDGRDLHACGRCCQTGGVVGQDREILGDIGELRR